jgi:DNA mismatch repair protein MLH3
MDVATAPIRPLPPDVVSHLRSTVIIPSLSSAISELVQNALDAAATKLTLTVDPIRPSFTLSDNGNGIPPNQIGLLGTLNSTSKFPPSDRYFGSRGEALASLARHSILTVTSRARGWRGSRQIRWSYGNRVFEGVPPDYASLPGDDAGTIVGVRGLWGDMPVRVKAREGMDMGREWRNVIRAVVALLMSRRSGKVGIVVRDETGARRLTIKPDASAEPWDLSVLRQGFGTDTIGLLEDWERVKAKQNGVRVEGWVSTKGIGNRSVQFLFVNGFPLMDGDTELHRELNRVFGSSGFGAAEDETKRGGGIRRGVDRCSMFLLRVECRRKGINVLGGEGGTQGKSGVEGEV